jgi:hypothetical protein
MRTVKQIWNHAMSDRLPKRILMVALVIGMIANLINQSHGRWTAYRHCQAARDLLRVLLGPHLRSGRLSIARDRARVHRSVSGSA